MSRAEQVFAKPQVACGALSHAAGSYQDTTHKRDHTAKGKRLTQTKYPESLSYLLVVAGAISILTAMWWAVISQVGYERQEVIARAVSRNEGVVIAYEEFVLRTLKGADALIRVMEGILRNNTPEVGVRKLKESGVLDDELFQSVAVLYQSS